MKTDILRNGKGWIKTDAKGQSKQTGAFSGDNKELGLVVNAIYHGRVAAQAIHEMIASETMPEVAAAEVIKFDKIKHSNYEAKPRREVEHLPVEERLKSLNAEITRTLTDREAIEEAKRCMSCGL